MPKIDIIKPELIWPGKYDDNGNRVVTRGVALPFQVVETIREGRATREPGRMANLFSYSKPQSASEWKNKLIWGDNLLVMASLLEEFAGTVDMIYIDSPFFTGTDQIYNIVAGEDLAFEKRPGAGEEVAYRNAWRQGPGSFMAWIHDRLSLMRELLSARGMIFIRFDQYWSHYVKVIADEVFGKELFQNEIVVKRIFKNVTGQGKVSIPLATDSLFLYFKSDAAQFNNTLIDRDQTREGYWRKMDDSSGVRRPPERHIFGKTFFPPSGKHFKFSQSKVEQMIKDGKIRLNPTTGRPEYWVEESDVKPLNSNWTDISGYSFSTGYPTENSEVLLSRVLTVGCPEGGLVADFFGGSGTTAAVAEKTGRKWISVDVGRFSIHTTRKRLLDIPDCRPFEILNLGKYERKYWQGVSFSDAKPAEADAAAIIAYVRFILDLYSAQPVAGTHIHGRKGSALVHVGAVDAPVTINEVNDAVAECVELKQKELHVLGWEWEMGLNDLAVQIAKGEHKIRLRLLNIPREVMEKRAVEAGDIRFFDLAHLEAEVIPTAKNKRQVKVKLKNFVIPDTDLIPEEVRDKITKWSDYIDYWAVDWDFRHDTFMNQWQAYRTRQNRKLVLESDEHEYTAAGSYNLLVKVVDIFGNDTSCLIEWQVK